MGVPAGAAGLEPMRGSRADGPEAMPVRRNRHAGRWVSALLVVAALAWLVRALLTNDTFDYGAVPEYLFDATIIEGVRNTVLLTVVAQGVGTVLGVLIAVGRLSPNPLMSSLSWLFVWFFRGTPVLVQIIFWFNLGLVFPSVGLSLPLVGELVSWETNAVITAFTAAILGLGINEGAYMAEIVRGGILSVDRGQTEAAEALGMTRSRTMRRIVLPQAMRVIIPPTGNELVNMLKTSSLVVVISYSELLTSAQNIYSSNLKTLELLVVASIWYLALTSVLSVGQFFLERRYSRGQADQRPRGIGLLRRLGYGRQSVVT